MHIMKLYKALKRVLPLFFIAGLAVGCDHSRQVVPDNIDVDDILRTVPFNESDAPEGYSYGPDSIPGYTVNMEMTTSNPEVYVYLNNIILVEVNPDITQYLFDFIREQLMDFDFIRKTDTIAAENIRTLMTRGMGFMEAVEKVIDSERTAFEEEMSKREELNDSPFNITFDIYPVAMDKEYITYLQTAYCYTGGAHGVTVKYLHTFDLKTGKLLTVNDIVKAERMGEVSEEVAAHMAYSYPIYENITTVDQYVDSLNRWLDHFDSTGITENLSVSHFPINDAALLYQGLAVVYQMYELTPGADGCPVVIVPYKDIKGCLNMTMKSL